MPQPYLEESLLIPSLPESLCLHCPSLHGWRYLGTRKEDFREIAPSWVSLSCWHISSLFRHNLLYNSISVLRTTPTQTLRCFGKSVICHTLLQCPNSSNGNPSSHPNEPQELIIRPASRYSFEKSHWVHEMTKTNMTNLSGKA